MRDLIEHVISGNEHVGQWAQHPVEPPARPDDMLAAHRTAAAAAHEVFAAPDGMSTTFKLPFGSCPARCSSGSAPAMC
ncbi:hypothetical protein BZL30_7930 [Mycobacterium kansasii]|uniref:Uncharacterized protein n=1 Tax=Mycobacterium kansasii TaxID=1768 RepID=A0A1V3WKF2_MYCKA|nr:hypothetical protein BZL30_7930 [Mycobacterium kansasii]